MSDLVLRWLEANPDGADALTIGREVLSLQGPDALVRRVAERAVASMSPVRRTADGRFRLAPGPPPPRVALVARATGPCPPFDQLLEVGVALVVDGGPGALWSAHVRPARPVPPEAARAAGVEPDPEGMPLAEALARLGPRLDGAEVVVWADDRGARFVFAALGRDPAAGRPAGLLRLRPALARAQRVPPRADLAAAAGALSVPVPLLGDAATAARTLAHLAARAQAEGIELEPPPLEPFDFAAVAFGPADLAALPDRPGVYRFLDADGQVLYVGKAIRLRERVASYFAARRVRRARYPELMARLRAFEFEETGSELEALLRERALIRALAPPLNVQRQVHPRETGSGALVLLLPGVEEGAVDLLLLRDGRIAGRASSDRRARGMRPVRQALRAAFFGPEPEPEPGEDDDAWIVAAWLRDQAERRPAALIDLSDAAGIAEAARRVRRTLTDAQLFSERVVQI